MGRSMSEPNDWPQKYEAAVAWLREYRPCTRERVVAVCVACKRTDTLAEHVLPLLEALEKEHRYLSTAARNFMPHVTCEACEAIITLIKAVKGMQT